MGYFWTKKIQREWLYSVKRIFGKNGNVGKRHLWTKPENVLDILTRNDASSIPRNWIFVQNSQIGVKG